MSALPTDTPLDLSVVIVNYNVRYFLEQCLRAALRACEELAAEIIVVDNASTDGSQEMVQTRFGDLVVLIANADNPGFSRANNQGIRIARGRYVLLLNPDTLVGEDTFRRCTAFMDAHPDAGALGVQMIDGQGIFLPESKRALPTPWVSFYKIFGLAALFPRNRRFGQYHLTYLDRDQNHPVEILSGAYMWLRRSVLDEIGLLDEAFFMYGEDIDLSYRVLQAGYRNYYLADTRILHYKGESTKKGSLNYVKVFYQAMIIFARKHFGGRRQQLFIAAIRLAVYFRATLALLQRLVQRLGLPLIEGGMIYGIMYGIMRYWEHYVKYIEGGTYPPVFQTVYMPAYTLVFVVFLWLAGAYRRPFRLRPLVLAPFWGFLAIASATYMFPFIHNFSRAIVGLSAVFGMVLALGIRGLIHRREKGRFFFTEPTRTRIAIAGTQAGAQRVTQLIRGELAYPADIAGLILDRPTPGALGTLAELPTIVEAYGIEEVVWCQEGLSATAILATMYRLPQVRYKIAPPGASFIIGPQHTLTSRHEGGSRLPLASADARRSKRLVDLVGAGLLMLAFPLSFWAYRRPGRVPGRLWQVLRGTRHLVGYAGTGAGLPPLLPGCLSLLPDSAAAPIDLDPLDRHYAQVYTWQLDAEVLLKRWRSIGRT
ncbi:MAG: glycosyltransferase [Bacteroidia bacterium]